jgi:hypothetical protein
MGGMRRILLALAAATSLALPLAVATPAVAAAPGCTSARPTSIGGAIYGYPDNRSVNVLIGIDLQNADRKKVDRDGNPSTSGTYLYRERINPTISADGSDDKTLTRTWGDPGTNGVFCLSSKVKYAYLEVYPQNSKNVTTKTRYGAAAHHAQPLTAGARHDIVLRVPLRRDFPGGITGYLNGYLSYQGKSIPPSQITRMRAFPRRAGFECGIEGFSANVDQIAVSTSRPATYYKLDHLAGGRCGQATQLYNIHMDCTCGGVKRTVVKIVEIGTGRGTGLNVSFG